MKNKLYGEINIGAIKRTNKQIKKHYTQMTIEEKEFLKNKLYNLDKESIYVSKHLANKFIGYSLDIVKELPFKDNVMDLIIEFNSTPMNNYIDKRVLLRTNEIFDVYINGEFEECNLCVVYSIINSKVVTVYWNRFTDNHATVDMRRYNKDLEIIF